MRTPFTYHGPNFLRPDGSVSTELAANIQAAYGRLPRVPVLDHHDMAHRDYNKQVWGRTRQSTGEGGGGFC